MGKTLYLECESGISGDMTVAALLDLGADQQVLKKALASLSVQGFDIRISRVKKSGLDACDFDVVLDKEHENHDHDMEYLHGHHHEGHERNHAHGTGTAQDHHHHEHRGIKEITYIIEHSAMTENAKKIALRIFEILAEAEIDKAILADAEVTRRSKLQNQITQIITFLQLLLRDDKLSATQESELDSTLSELYSDFGITHDNLSLYDANGKIKTMPTIQDLYDRCTKNPKLESIVSILYPFVSPQGNCRNMNGQTNLDLKNRVIAFDVSNAGRILEIYDQRNGRILCKRAYKNCSWICRISRFQYPEHGRCHQRRVRRIHSR